MASSTLKQIRAAKIAIAKAIGEDLAFELSEIEKIPISLLSLNRDIGGGLPKGRIIEVFGFEHTGKTTLCLEFVKAIQKEGAVLYLEPENALDPKYLERIGVDTSEEKWIYVSPTTMEDCFIMIREFLKKKAIAGFVFDSLPAAPTAYEMGKGEDKEQMAEQARIISKSLRRLVGYIKKSGCVAIFVNHLKDSIGAYSQAVSTGGRALKFYSSLRLRTTSGKSEYFQTNGFKQRIKVIKEKTGGERNAVSEYHIKSKKGIIKSLELLDIALRQNIIKRKGGWYHIGKNKFQGKEKMMAAIMKSKKLRAMIVKSAKHTS